MMVLRAGSATKSYASFQAELEGVILQQTAAVDFYLATAAPKWTGASADEQAAPEALRPLFLADLSRSFWQSTAPQEAISRAHGVPLVRDWAPASENYQQVSSQLLRHAKRRPRTRPLQVNNETRLQSYLEQQAVALHEQLGCDVLGASTAVFAAEAQTQACRRCSSGSSQQVPEPQCNAANLSTGVGAADAPRSQVVSPATVSTALAVEAAETSAAAAAFAEDEDIAAQKQAARAKLAELQGQKVPASEGATMSSMFGKAATGKAATGKVKDIGGASHSSVHSLEVLKRPLGLASTSSTAFASPGFDVMKDPDIVGYIATNQRCRFTTMMKQGLLLCMVMLAVSWLSQRFGGALLQSWLRQMTQSLVSYVYVPFTTALLVGALIAAWVPQPPVLHFANPGLETQYLAWSNTGKLLVDCMFQILFLVVGSCLWLRLENTELQTPEYAAAHASTLLAVISMVCSGMPVLFILLLRSVQYLQWREQLLTGSRLCSVVALALVHLYSSASDLAQLPLGMSFVALTQLMGLACMQVRLATFVPCQVAHLLVLLFKTSVANPSLHFAQLIGGGLCLPCLLLHSLELYSRKAFLATMNNAPKKHKQA